MNDLNKKKISDNPEISFLFKMLMKMEGTLGAALVYREGNKEGKVLASILKEKVSGDSLAEIIKVTSHSTDRIGLELNYGFYKGNIGKFLIRDLNKNNVLIILFDMAMDANQIFSHYFQIISFIGDTLLDVLQQNNLLKQVDDLNKI